MYNREVIDGPVDPKFKKYKDYEIAHGLMQSVEAMGWWMHTTDKNQEMPQGYRISSYVESKDYDKGYALGLSRVSVAPIPVVEFAIQCHFFEVDLNKIAVIDKKILEVRTTITESKDQIDEARSVLDRDEMILTISMLGKTGLAISRGVYTNDVDADVAHAIMNTTIEPSKANGMY